MKNLQEIKDTYAKEQGYEDWEDLRIELYGDARQLRIEEFMDEICIRTQKAYGETIKESVSTFIESDLTVNDIFIDDYVNIISKITNPENLIR